MPATSSGGDWFGTLANDLRAGLCLAREVTTRCMAAKATTSCMVVKAKTPSMAAKAETFSPVGTRKTHSTADPAKTPPRNPGPMSSSASRSSFPSPRFGLSPGQGVPARELATRAGHSKPSMTLDVYTSVAPIDEATLEQLTRLI